MNAGEKAADQADETFLVIDRFLQDRETAEARAIHSLLLPAEDLEVDRLVVDPELLQGVRMTMSKPSRLIHHSSV